MASNNTASIAQARKLVEQLKMEANIDRIKSALCWSVLRRRHIIASFVCRCSL
ncbi:GNG2 isoform 4, partial [Pan troglodytes]